MIVHSELVHGAPQRRHGSVMKTGPSVVGARRLHGITERRPQMLRWALIFLVISIVAAIFGFGGISAAAADIARVLFFIFIVFFLVLLIAGLSLRPKR